MALNTAQSRILAKRPRPNRKLTELRINAGLTPNLLGRRAGVSGHTVRAAEAGHYIEVPQQESIASALGQKTLDLFPYERQRVPA